MRSFYSQHLLHKAGIIILLLLYRLGRFKSFIFFVMYFYISVIKVFIVYLVNCCAKQVYTVLTNFKKGLIMYKFLPRKLKLKRGLNNYIIIYFSSTHSNNAFYNKWSYLYLNGSMVVGRPKHIFKYLIVKTLIFLLLTLKVH